MKTLNDLVDQIVPNLNNPSFTMGKVLNYFIDNQPVNLDVANTSSPFVNLMQAGAAFASASVDVHNLNLGKLYTSLATSRVELYTHLNELDFQDAFARPARVKFNFFIDIDTIIRYGVEKSNYHEVTLIKGCTLKAGGVDYVLDRTYNIRIISKQLSKVFTTNNEGNKIISPSEIITARDNRLIVIVPVEADQLKVSLGTYDVSLSGVFRKGLSIPNNFSRVDVFTLMNNKWQPLETTFSSERYDRYKTLVHITPLDGELEIYIPPIYTAEGLVSSNLLVLGYSTKPGGHHDFINTPMGSTRVVNQDPMEDEQLDTVQAFSKTTYYVTTEQIIQLGRDALTDEELHWRIQHRAYSKQFEPLTHRQMYASIKNLGYTGILYSNHQARIVQTWLLTSNVISPRPDAAQLDNPLRKLITPPECGFINIESNLETLAKVFGIRSTSYSVTIPPEIFYERDEDDVYMPRSVGHTNALALLSPHELASKMNTGSLYHSPYYYNLYKKDGVLETRVYDFKDPKIISLSTNTLTNNGNYIVLMDRVTVINQEDNFLIEIVTAKSASNDTLSGNDLFAHLSWEHEQVRYFIDTDDITKLNGEFLIRFRIDTNYEILPDEDIIVLTNAVRNLSVNFEEVPFNINGRFNVTFGTQSAPSGWIDNTIDQYVYRVMSGDVRIPLSLETIHLDLGTNLKYLWKSSVFLGDQNEFARWDHDVAVRYTSSSIEINTSSPVPFAIGDNCSIEFKNPENEGDVVRDEEGNILYKHRKGDVMFDEYGNPIILDVMKQNFKADIFVLNAMSFFVTGPQKAYVRDLVSDVTLKSAVTILPLVERILEHVAVFNYPMNMIGKSRTKPDASYPPQIDLPQRLKLKFIVPNNLMTDHSQRSKLERLAIEAIDEQLKESSVSVKKMNDAIMDRLPPDIQDVAVQNLGFSPDALRVTLVNTRDRMSIRQKLVASQAGFLMIVEDIEITYST